MSSQPRSDSECVRSRPTEAATHMKMRASQIKSRTHGCSPPPGTFTVLLSGAWATQPENVSRVVTHPPKK